MGRSVTTRVLGVTDPLGWELTAGAGAQFGLLAALSAAGWLHAAGWLAGVAYAVVGGGTLTAALHRSGARALGAANRVTLLRAVLVGGVTALAADTLALGSPVRVLVGITVVALVLDAVDGRVARRTGTVTALGARFDMEVDAFLILVLSALAADRIGSGGGWVLAIGAMRYAFVVAGWALAWLRSPLPVSTARKAVAALQGIALAVSASGVLPGALAAAPAAIALALLTWSFGRDVVWLWRRRTPTPAGR